MGHGLSSRDALRRGWLILLAWLASAAPILAGEPRADVLRGDEDIILFPTLGSLSSDGTSWLITVHGWVYEKNFSDRELKIWEKLLDIDDRIEDPVQRGRLRERLKPFLVDNERGRRVEVTIGSRRFVMPPSQPNGHFRDLVRMPADEIALLRGAENPTDVVTCRVTVPPGDPRTIEGRVHLLAPTGISVISDIDDTIRVTGIGSNKAVFRSTFLDRLRAVDGMPELLRSWKQEHGATFHYASANPWQMYVMLEPFFKEAGIPTGTFHLKPVRLKDRSLLTLFASPVDYKPTVIEPVLERYPRRAFVLVGDTTEKDPEIFAAFARKYPQVRRILIRDVGKAGPDAPRFREAFEGLPRELWQVFTDPAEIRGALSELGAATQPHPLFPNANLPE